MSPVFSTIGHRAELSSGVYCLSVHDADFNRCIDGGIFLDWGLNAIDVVVTFRSHRVRHAHGSLLQHLMS